MEKTLISRQNLAKRWDFTSTKVIEKYEGEGILTRVPGLPSPRYSLDEVMKIEMLNEDVNPLSPLQRKKLEMKLSELESKLAMYESKFEAIKSQLL